MEKGDRIIIKERDNTGFLYLKDITHITCSGSLCTVHRTNGKTVSICKLLKQFEEELTESGFIRINHCTLINFNRLENIKLGKCRKLLLDETTEFTISRRKMYKIREIIK